jgi:hypothetical protein
MPSGRLRVQVAATALAVGALLGASAGTAAAWPIPLTSDQVSYLDATRGAFPGDDDARLMAGDFACHLLYSGQSSSAAADQVAAQYGAEPGQAAGAVHAAHGTLCRQAPG